MKPTPVQHGDTRLPARFWNKVQTDDSGCWLWTGALSSVGRPCFAVRGVSQLAYRVAYSALVDRIPDGLTIDHICRTPRCVRPDHLEAVTVGENSMRRFGSHEGLCAKGHPMSYHLNGRGYCPTCRRPAPHLAPREPAAAGMPRPRALRTHCPRGHEYTRENTYLTPHKSGSIGRECKICKKYYAKHGHYPLAVGAA